MSEPPTALRFIVPGEPLGKERPRGIIRKLKGGKAFTKMVTPPRTRAYEEKIRTLAQIAVNQSRWCWSDEDEFMMIVRIFHEYPKRRSDCDNVFKACADACNGVTYGDDKSIKGGSFWRERDQKNPRVEVEIRRVTAQAA